MATASFRTSPSAASVPASGGSAAVSAPGFEAGRAEPAEFAFAALGAGGQSAQAEIAELERFYAPDLCLRRPGRVHRGPGGVLAETLADLAAVPDARHVGEDAFGYAPRKAESEGLGGLYMAARTLLLGNHRGSGLYGAPTGRPVRRRCLAELWAAHDTVRDGWIIQDHAAVLVQTGGPAPADWARARIAASGHSSSLPAPLTPETDLEGPFAGRGRRGETGAALADAVGAVMDGDFAALDRVWDPACALSYPGGLEEAGTEAARAFWAGLRSAFPAASFRVEHCLGLPGDEGVPPRAALRWSLYGRHDGFGRFGPPSGAYVYVMGMTQAEFGPRGLRREWTLIDDLAIWTQIVLAAGG